MADTSTTGLLHDQPRYRELLAVHAQMLALVNQIRDAENSVTPPIAGEMTQLCRTLLQAAGAYTQAELLDPC